MSHSNLSNDDDIEAILKIAVTQSSSIDGRSLRDRLMASAAELGLTPDQVAAAEEQWAREEKERRDLVEFTALRKKRFWSKFGSFAALDAVAVAVNMVTAGSIGWAVWFLLWTGFALVMYASGTFFPNSVRFQRRFRRWRRKRDAGTATDETEDY